MATARFVIVCLALFASRALAADRTLGTATPSCKDKFEVIVSDNYGDDYCHDLLEEAFSTAPSTPEGKECPGGGIANPGTEVHKCMSKNSTVIDSWVSFIMGCEILNVNERTGAGEAEAAADATPSCFPRFNSLQAFKDYLNTPAGAASSTTQSSSGADAAAVAKGTVLLAAAAATAGFAMLL